MTITILPDGTPEDQARMKKSAALANKLDLILQAERVTEGTAIEALGLLWGTKAKTAEQAAKYATDIAMSIGACFQLKEQASGK